MNHGCVRVRWPARQGGAALVVGLILLVVITLVGVSAMQNTTLQEKMAGNLRDSNLAFQAAEAALRSCENILDQSYAYQIWTLRLPLGNSQARNVRPQALLMDQNQNLLLSNTANPLVTPIIRNLMVWIWSLDEDQMGTNFPGLAGNRLDPAPGNTQLWWTERNDAWWQSPASNSQVLPANTLEGLFGMPRCLIEEYVYNNPATNPVAWAFLNARFSSGTVMDKPESLPDAGRVENHYYRITSRGVGGSNNAVSILQSTFYFRYYVPQGS